MNAKVKLIAVIAAVQLIVPTVFAQKATIIPGSVYQVTGRVVEMDARSIVISSRGPTPGNMVILRRNDTRYWSQIRVGDMVTIKYNLMATDVAPVTPIAPPRRR